jgi:xanthine dehydrogenase accessory factor
LSGVEPKASICASWLVLVLGGGDLGTGVAHRLSRCGFEVIVAELAQPSAVRRTVAFGSAVYEGEVEVEGIRSALAADADEARRLLDQGTIPVMIASPRRLRRMISPDVLVDARMAKRNLGTHLGDAPIVVGLGPGFTAGQDVQAVVETNRGHNLGRVILAGTAERNTGIPSPVQGHAHDRVLWSPCNGTFQAVLSIGDLVNQGQQVASVSGTAILAPIGGVVRGLAHDGLVVQEAQKVGDIDPRGVREYCFTISDKARAVGGGVIEAILFLHRHLAAPR